jgi:hypothetical protein
VKLKAAFVGISPARSKGVVSVIESASEAELTATHLTGPSGTGKRPGDDFDAIFINRDLKESQLQDWLRAVRQGDPGLPVVLVYRSEPDGRAFLLAKKFDCWLFTEDDRMGRTLSPAELGTALVRKAEERSVQHRLMEVSLSAGPCSTGS